MKKITLILLLLLGVSFSYGQTILAKEDIAIIGVNTDNEDFTFLLRVGITAGTQIYFSDNEVNATGTGLQDLNEGVVLFTAATDYTCGTIISFLQNNAEFTSVSGLFMLNNSGDQVLAFQGFDVTTRNWTTFLHANTDPPITLPVGFTSADIVDGNRDNREYIGGTSDPSWTDLNTFANYNHGNNYSGVTLSTSPFICTTCSGSTVTWIAGAWLPISGPNLSTPVIIADNFDTTIDGSFSACSLTINININLNVNNGDYVEVQNDVTVDGELFVQSQGNFVQNSDTASFTDNSTNGVQVLKGKTFPRKFSYTYWSSPIVDETIEQVFSTVQGDRRFSFNAANFVDVQQEDGNSGVFNPGSDDIDDNGDDWQIASGTMQPGVGYAAIASQLGPAFPRTESFTFTGEFNNGTIQVPLVNNSGGAYNDWNFIGNPYPCAIDADEFLSVNSALVGALYFWDQATPESDTAGGSQGQNFSVDDYATYNGTMGIGARAGTGAQPNGFVASCQGFFVEALTAGNVTFNNSMRTTTNDNSQFFKNVNSKNNSSSSSFNKLWVNLTTDNGVFSQIGVGYVTGATDFNDGVYYDAKRIISSGNAAILYSTIENDTDKFAIQGKAISSLDSNENIRLGLSTNIEVATVYTLSIAQFEGNFIANNSVYLKDNLTNTIHNLSDDGDYSFTSEVGEFNDRFEIAFNADALSNDGFELNTNAIKIIQLENEAIQFTTEVSTFTSISVFDLLGRTLYKLNASSNDETYNLNTLKSSVYIATIELANGSTLSKKFIKK
ncbi:T9SS type A sorting domain-containing protein [Hyunsoonleella pacifica]|uniref:T9SS type A sorting domain-containing protein n=1 Tax=Hyunsoonleella pacifica TaxID=1080224 RepID=A0A4Q9FP04_9FLAO|nr:T9SS type A sorting domain-containing protein [Hyunsoonleella pacifica]TBN16536.1 T9SS type A sorting domain-containing protein [Hyunsoonleella pacifica]GGD18598.1 hypothetical protein GCM10011368_20620 [Hyunsoonleella pacifica]